MSVRLRMALADGDLVLPEAGLVSVIRPPSGMDLTDLPTTRVEVVQPVKPDHDAFLADGYTCLPESDAGAAMVLVCLPRSKTLARALISTACTRSEGMVVVDGVKTDGIESLLRACRERVSVHGPITKAHGKLFWFDADPAAFADWQTPDEQIVQGYVTAPGVFSADGPDPASVALVAALPALSGHVIDLGAGWGFLAASIADRARITTLDLVEADATALDCARRNVTDDRARFHWADATTWSADAPADVVLMNPPFHTGRAADPSLGQKFIHAAARNLATDGQLWMVANRHLPYETTLKDVFSEQREVAGDSRFKVLQAQRPIRDRRAKTVRRTRTARR